MLGSAREGASLATKFRGCLVGALMGDCLGSSFEGEAIVSKVVLQKYFDTMEGPYVRSPVKMYTDDTAMTKCTAESLIHCKLFNEKDMAKRYVTEYFQSPRRGYGQNVVSVFHKLKSSKFEDVWLPAREQFSGTGSYGNGGSMRISPVALYLHHNYPKMLEVAAQSTRLTHTNLLGINGSLLQCIAVHQSLALDPEQPVNVQKFTDDLIEKMAPIEAEDEYINVDSQTPYQDQLKQVKKLLAKDDAKLTDGEVISSLGNTVAALYSVPTAIFAFLKAQAPIKDIKTDNTFRRTLQYSISLGGDTDTIASMAGAISGAYHGYSRINLNLQKHCEDVEGILQLSEDLFKVAQA